MTSKSIMWHGLHARTHARVYLAILIDVNNVATDCDQFSPVHTAKCEWSLTAGQQLTDIAAARPDLRAEANWAVAQGLHN